jgi:ETFB lysine methyltransferase
VLPDGEARQYSTAVEPAMEALEHSLRDRFRIRETEVPMEDSALRILHPANADDLISEDDFVRDERLPYWADLWPSALSFARLLPTLPRSGERLIELGCGAGLVSTAAAASGYEVTATDYYADALAFARVNAWRNTRREIAIRHLDWRAFPDDVGKFDCVVACDVIYEKAYASLVAGAIRKTLAEDGIAWVADPGRTTTNAFLESVRDLGLTCETRDRLPFVDGEISQTIIVWELRHRR